MKFIYSIILFIFLSLFSQAEKSTKAAYLGVYASVLEPGVSYQLGLPENLHLSVERIAKDSPAEKGGILKHDILLKFDDQILVNPEQLKFLVRSKKPGEQIILTFLRRAKELKSSIVLDEIEINNLSQRNKPGQLPRFLNRRGMDFDPFLKNDFPFELFNNFDDQFLQQNRDFLSQPSLPIDPSDDPVHPNTNKQTLFQQSRQSQVMITDEKGTLEWNEKNGQKFLRATDPTGKVLFDGSIDTIEERNKLDKDLRGRLENLEKGVTFR